MRRLLLLLLLPILYTLAALAIARADGVYATPQQGIIARAERHYANIDSLNIDIAGPNKHEPYIWYVTYRVCAQTYADGTPLWRGRQCEGGGNYYLHMRDGWVMMGEIFFPETVGRMMYRLGLAGE